ncbi:phage head-binding domain-containing protein [Escherichia coli]
MTDITANVIVSMPSQLFTMARSFKAVANGKIYIGKIDTDPVNPENQIQVYVENEDGSHVPVSQPIIINAAGYPVYNGQIAKFVTVQGHSMAVYDAYGSQQFYFPNVLKYDPSSKFPYLDINLLNLWDKYSKLPGYNLIGYFKPGVTINNPCDVVLHLDSATVYRYTATIPHTITSDEEPSGFWLPVKEGIEAASSADMTRLISEGHYIIEKNADFLIPGLIPGSYNRSDRSFSDGYEFRYGGIKHQKQPFGVFEDACVLTAVAATRDAEHFTGILGAGTGQSLAQYGSTDTAATYFENTALPPLYTLTGAIFSTTGASSITIDPAKVRINMTAVVIGSSKTWFGLIRGFNSSSITVDGWYEKTSGTQSTPSGTLYISPVYRVWGNNTVVTVPEDAAATSAVGMEVMLNLYKDGTGSDSQVYKAINNNAFNPDEIVDSAYQAVGKFGKAHDVWPGSTYSYRSWGATSYGFFSDHDQSGIKILTPNAAAFVLASQVDGVGEETNVLIIDPAGSITQTNRKGVNEIAAQFGPNGAAGVVIRQQASGGANASDAVMFVGKSSATDRSINCAGTVNSSGADYAEYFYKSEGCGDIKPGDICGIDADGNITDRYDSAVSFMVKSTNPCLVGGDTWLQSERPEYPSQEWAEWEKKLRKQKPVKPEYSMVLAMIRSGMSQEEAESVYAEYFRSYEAELVSWNSEQEWARNNEPDMESAEYKQWIASSEEERKKVDRLAFCGRVPVNVIGGNPGEYLIPQRDSNGGISGVYISEPSFIDYRKAVGRVVSVNESKEVTITVLVH